MVWGDWALDSLQAIAVYYATGAVPTLGLVPKLADLTKLIQTLWNVRAITIDRWRILVAQDYLMDYFRYGGDLRSIALKYRLPASTRRREIIKAIAKNTVTPS